jgi:hypothetical protein
MLRIMVDARASGFHLRNLHVKPRNLRQRLQHNV